MYMYIDVNKIMEYIGQPVGVIRKEIRDFDIFESPTEYPREAIWVEKGVYYHWLMQLLPRFGEQFERARFSSLLENLRNEPGTFAAFQVRDYNIHYIIYCRFKRVHIEKDDFPTPAQIGFRFVFNWFFLCRSSRVPDYLHYIILSV